MTGTKSKGTEGLLKVAIGLCILFSLANLSGIIYTHIPPFEEGQCFVVPSQGVTAVVEANHIFGGYSDVAATSAAGTQRGPVAFLELRTPAFKKAECK